MYIFLSTFNVHKNNKATFTQIHFHEAYWWEKREKNPFATKSEKNSGLATECYNE